MPAEVQPGRHRMYIYVTGLLTKESVPEVPEVKKDPGPVSGNRKVL
jgi:hypothetical protein